MKKRKSYSSWWRPYDNLTPGTWRGIKAKKRQGKLLPSTMMWDGRTYIYRDRELNLGSDRTWFKPFKSKPVNRRERRGQSRPR